MPRTIAIFAITAALAGPLAAQDVNSPGNAAGGATGAAGGPSNTDSGAGPTGGTGGQLNTTGNGTEQSKSPPPNGCDPKQAEKPGQTQNNASAGCVKP